MQKYVSFQNFSSTKVQLFYSVARDNLPLIHKFNPDFLQCFLNVESYKNTILLKDSIRNSIHLSHFLARNIKKITGLITAEKLHFPSLKNVICNNPGNSAIFLIKLRVHHHEHCSFPTLLYLA